MAGLPFFGRNEAVDRMTFTIATNDLAPSTAEEQTSDTTLAFSPTATVAVDRLAILPVVWDNVSTANADDTTFLSVSDTKSNTWTRAAECQYSAGGVLDGVMAGLFYSVITTDILTSDTITITSTAVGTAKGCTLATFNRDTSKTVGVAGKGYQRVAASASYTATVSGLTSEEHLWIGVNAMENDATNTNQTDASYTLITQGATNSFGTTGLGDVNVGARAAYLISTGTTETYDRASLSTQDRATLLVAFREITGGAGTTVTDPFGMSGFFGG
jgi:hypothetical protein